MSEREATITRLREKAAEESGEETEEVIEVGDEEVEELLEEIPVKSSTREYVVLVNTGQAWKELGRTVASTSTGAIHATLGEKLEPNVEYVAVPVRSWKPDSFVPETKTTYKRVSK